MSTKKNVLQEVLSVLHDRENFFQRVSETNFTQGLIGTQIALMGVFTFFYGIIMGSYNSWLQAMVTGVKLWLLIFLTLLICFPSFYIVQLILGSKIKIKQLIIILLGGFVMTSAIMAAFAPIVLFFQLSGGNYHFLQLLHVFVFVFAGFFGMRLVLEALKSCFAKDGVYPKQGLVVFRIWVIIFAFVGIQLSWNLRPFIGTKEMPFEIFRTETRGNFYSTLLSSVGHLMGVSGNSEEASTPEKQVEKGSTDTPPEPAKQPEDSLSEGIDE